MTRLPEFKREMSFELVKERLAALNPVHAELKVFAEAARRLVEHLKHAAAKEEATRWLHALEGPIDEQKNRQVAVAAMRVEAGMLSVQVESADWVTDLLNHMYGWEGEDVAWIPQFLPRLTEAKMDQTAAFLKSVATQHGNSCNETVSTERDEHADSVVVRPMPRRLALDAPDPEPKAPHETPLRQKYCEQVVRRIRSALPVSFRFTHSGHQAEFERRFPGKPQQLVRVEANKRFLRIFAIDPHPDSNTAIIPVIELGIEVGYQRQTMNQLNEVKVHGRTLGQWIHRDVYFFKQEEALQKFVNGETSLWAQDPPVVMATVVPAASDSLDVGRGA